jgi:hypothetical protein
MNFNYLLAKILKKLRGSTIKNSTIHKTSKVESGCVYAFFNIFIISLFLTNHF